MQERSGSFAGLDGVSIFTHAWLPDAPPRAVILLVHGVGEHLGRYHHVARALVERGYAVYALDHRGHGQSGGKRGHVKHFSDFVADLSTYYEQVRAENPGLPLFVYGHSMGSLISLLFAETHQDQLAGLITSGTVLALAGVNVATKTMIGLARRLAPDAPLIPLVPAGVSRDPEVVRRYIEDPLVYHQKMRVGLVLEIVHAGERAARLLPTLRLPYLVLHGGSDPICLPVSAQIIREACPNGNVMVKVYEGLFHEVHNEPEQDTVLRDIGEWLDAQMAAHMEKKR